MASTTDKGNKLRLDELQLNKEYDATVEKVTEYGAFVDIGAVRTGTYCLDMEQFPYEYLKGCYMFRT